MKKILTLALLIWGVSVSVFSQEKVNRIELPERYKMIGMNMTPLLTQLIPFNRSEPSLSGPYSLNYRAFRDNNAFRFGLGAHVTESSIDDSNQSAHFNIRFGWERRKLFYERWSYSFGLDLFASSGNFNLLSSNQNDTDEGVFGAGFVWGTEYFLNQRVSLSLEMQFFAGLGFDTAAILFIPPVGLNLNFVLPKRKRQ